MPLDVAVAVAPDEVVERVAVGDVAGVGHPQHLAVDRAGVLGAGRVLGVAGRRRTAARRARRPARRRCGGSRSRCRSGSARASPSAAVVGHPHDPVVVVGGEVGVEQPVVCERRGAGPGRAARSRRPRRAGCARRGCRPRRCCPSVTRSSRPVSRSPTSAEPSGRNAMPHGTASPVTTSPATCGSARPTRRSRSASVVAVGGWGADGVGVGVVPVGGVGGPLGVPPLSSDDEQAASDARGPAHQQRPPTRAHVHGHVASVGCRSMGMEELDPIETASLDELRSLQTERLRATIQHTYANVAHYREAWDAAGVHPDDVRELSDLAQAAVHDQGRPARQLPVRDVRGAARAGGAGARVQRYDGPADRRRLHRRGHRHVGRR